MYSLQTSVTVNNKEYHITNDGDFRMVLDCFDALGDEEMSEDLRVLASLLIFYNEFNSAVDVRKESQDDIQTLVTEMYKFFNCGQNDAPGAKVNKPLIDWHTDSQMICSAINNVAHQEVRAVPYCHWWTFMGYYISVGESTLSTVVGIRNKLLNHKKLEKWEQEFKQDNPHYFTWRTTTVQDRQATEAIRNIWNKGG